ncbi:MAG: helix-turn-helix domain-containing protein [candidate division NC10 bacterium]
MRSSAALKQVPAAQNNSPQLLTAQELARGLKLNPQTLYRLARQGVIPAIRIGKKSLRFDAAQVRNALQAPTKPLTLVALPSSAASRVAFTMLGDLLAQGRWLAAPPALSLKRFAVRFPPRADLTALAYERGRP